MRSTTPTLAEVLTGAIETKLEGIHTAMPGRIETWDPRSQRASVQPLIRRGYYDDEGERHAERLPTVHSVPVVFPGAGGFRLTMPVKPGDVVLLVFTSCSLDRWLTHGGEVDPQDDRRNHLSDAIAIPGLYSFKRTPTDEVDDGAMVLHAPSGSIKLGDRHADDPVIRKSDLDAFIATFNAHVHTVPGGTSAVPTQQQTAIDGSPVVKVK